MIPESEHPVVAALRAVGGLPKFAMELRGGGRAAAIHDVIEHARSGHVSQLPETDDLHAQALRNVQAMRVLNRQGIGFSGLALTFQRCQRNVERAMGDGAVINPRRAQRTMIRALSNESAAALLDDITLVPHGIPPEEAATALMIAALATAV